MPAYSYDVVMSITPAEGMLVLDPYYVTRMATFEAPFMVFASDGEPAEDESAPQTDRALALRPDRAEWEASDQEEIDTLRLKLGAIEEIVANGNERVWTLKVCPQAQKNTQSQTNANAALDW
jgi:hypothetical protein